jgi:hypothetical protein
MSRDAHVPALLVRLTWIGITVIACLMPVHNDTWWHLRAGYEMLQTKSVLLTDIFSHSVFGTYWPNNGWLGQVVFASIHAIGGLPLLTALCAASVTAGLWLTYLCIPGDAIRRLMLLAAVMTGVPLTWAVRPQVFSLLLLGATVFLVRTRRWLLLPPLFLAWSNLHSAVGLGLAVLAGSVVGHLMTSRRVPARLAAAVALSGAATLCTPQGLDYWPGIAESMTRSRANQIVEWLPPDMPPAHLVFWAGAVALPLLTLVKRRTPLATDGWSVILGALFLLPLAVRSLRNVSPFLMVAAPAIGFLLDGSPPQKSSTRVPTNGSRRKWPRLLVAGACLVAATFVVRTWLRPPERMDWAPMSADASAAIDGCRGPLYNTYFDGGAIIYFAPHQPVLLDSRQDPFPIELVQAQHEAEMSGDYHGLFDRYGIACAALTPQSPLRPRLERDGWIRRFEDRQWVVLERPQP